ncbi:MAG: OadG family protein [Oscillospiraceae bacterium]|jgi:Na+-transporting methylmalonyl-CoA/oxaloacetate decarboxylase gamma subunit|nr:OadG family protein [Oscillospiraceae bacterium]
MPLPLGEAVMNALFMMLVVFMVLVILMILIRVFTSIIAAVVPSSKPTNAGGKDVRNK